MKPKNHYVTTAIPYVNARPHIGFALELVQADVLARYFRLLGKTIHFQTGTDENAFKNVIAAREQGISIHELVDRNSNAFRDLAHGLGISNDDFIRTTEQRHHAGVNRFWKSLNKDDLYVKSYTGLYCVGCEDFYLEHALANGLCPDHGTPPKIIEERNIFFRLSSYQERLEKIIENDHIRIVPEKRKNEVLRFIRDGLQDISISRSADRSGGWGIPVPGDSTQVIYVWIDALINYITGLGYGSLDSNGNLENDWQNTWNEDTHKTHVIGKNVWKFHAVYWPALLLSANLPLPNELLVHGFLTENGRKISKSLGNSVDPFEYINQYGADGVRHYLLKAVSPIDDGDFSKDRIQSVYHSELANGLGNLVSRVTSLCAKGRLGSYSPPTTVCPYPGFDLAITSFRLDDAANIIWTAIASVNADVARTKPWELLKATDLVALHRLLKCWLDEIYRIAFWVGPFIPDASLKIIEQLKTSPICVSSALFPRLEKDPIHSLIVHKSSIADTKFKA